MEDSMSDIIAGRPIVYKRRWFIVFVLCWLNVTNGMIWISYANISDKTAYFYGVSVDYVNFLSLVFPVVTIVLGLPSIWALDRMGIRVSFNVCAMLNLLSVTFRLLCAYNSVAQRQKFPLAMVGQVIGAIAQPLAMFSSARVASVWFAADQRTIATTLSAIGNPVGVLLGLLLPPIIMQDDFDFNNVALALFALALVGALLSCLGVCRSAPSHRPAASSDRPALAHSFRTQLRLCLGNRQFILLAVVFGMALGLFSTLSTLLEQILCPYGYSPQFAGLCGALLIGCGLVGSLASGMLADRTKALAEIVQGCFALASLGIVAFSMASIFPAMEAAILAAICWTGFFGVALYSVAFELAAEITYPASENVSTGLLVVAGQIFTVVFVLLSIVLVRPLSNPLPVTNLCVNPSSQSLWPLDTTMAALAVLGASVLLLAFSAHYRRRSTDAALISAQDDYEHDLLVSHSE